MKKFVLVLLAPFLMATQCEDDFDNSGFETSYLIQNNSNTDLFLLDETDSFTLIKANAILTIATALNLTTHPIKPSESLIFTGVSLYKKENDDFILSYRQSPLSDGSWELREPQINRFEYTLLITDQLID